MEVLKYLKELDINVDIVAKVTDISMEDKKITGIYLADGSYVKGDVFIETTGSTGLMDN